MIIVAVFISLVVFVLVCLPFFVGKGGQLSVASALSSEEELRERQQVILDRYVSDERAFKGGLIGRVAWDKRRVFLVNRYVDVTRRLDFLTSDLPPKNK